MNIDQFFIAIASLSRTSSSELYEEMLKSKNNKNYRGIALDKDKMDFGYSYLNLIQTRSRFDGNFWWATLYCCSVDNSVVKCDIDCSVVEKGTSEHDRILEFLAMQVL